MLPLFHFERWKHYKSFSGRGHFPCFASHFFLFIDFFIPISHCAKKPLTPTNILLLSAAGKCTTCFCSQVFISSSSIYVLRKHKTRVNMLIYTPFFWLDGMTCIKVGYTGIIIGCDRYAKLSLSFRPFFTCNTFFAISVIWGWIRDKDRRGDITV